MTPNERQRQWRIDHRDQWLATDCNRAIGLFKDNTEAMAKAIKLLLKWKANCEVTV